MRLAAIVCLGLVAPLVARAADAKETSMPPAPIVFFDIAGPDMTTLRGFYAGVMGWDVAASGAIKGAGVDGSLRQDPASKILYVGVPDVTAALAQVTAHGGTVVAPRFAVKGVAVLGLFKDPAGNAMGFVEMKDGKPVVP
ncbi:MAG TPA: VOC family protein [Rhizomicrobium sp.]